MEVAALGNALTNRMLEVARRTEAVESGFKRHQAAMITFTVLVVLMVLMLRFGRRLMARLFAEKTNSGFERLSAGRGTDLAAEEKVFAEFAASFRIGPGGIKPRAVAAPVANATAEKPAAKAEPTPAPAPQRTPSEFLIWAPTRVGRCRFLLQEINRMKDDAQKKLVAELAAEVQKLKADSSHPDLTPIWQVTSSAEGLIKQLTDKPANLNASTLRTLAGCVDLLDRLCEAGLNPDLLKSPPVRFLAVDDDPISRHTISFALKRALNAPDVAPNGAAGLALAEENVYDAIFLDVQMPEMDGFELCRRIRAGGANQSTPIVFVTCQSDFNSRTQSSLAGGCDLIGKPFLTFEVTAKALLLALGGRLKRLEPAQIQVA
jgi:CheY-like chemotaxis protein